MSSFAGGDWLYICYRYMDRFHCEPLGWADLFDYLEYMEIDSKIADHLRSIRKEQ